MPNAFRLYNCFEGTQAKVRCWPTPAQPRSRPRTDRLRCTRLADREPVRLLAVLDGPDDEDDPADQGDEPEEEEPAAAVGVVEAAGADGEGGKEDSEREEGGERLADDAGCGRRKEREEEEPPVLGARGASFERGVLLEADADRFTERHFQSPFAM